MAKTSIEWTATELPNGTFVPGYSFNPWIGCTAVSEACKFCYAKTLVENRMGRDFAERWRTSASYWKQPLRWNKQAEQAGTRKRVFCASLADVFDNQVPEEWRADLFDLIRATPMLDWQLLTKRPQNIAKMLPADWGDGYPNVWLGTTCENQTEADRRIRPLLSVPAAIHFLSCEPLLGPINLTDIQPNERDHSVNGMSCLWHGNPFGGAMVDWVIAGGESGSGARPSHPDWIRSLRDQCAVASVPFFFKQWGEFSSAASLVDATHAVRKCDGFMHDLRVRGWDTARLQEAGDRWNLVHRVGKKRAGALLDGREHKEFPAGLVPGGSTAMAG